MKPPRRFANQIGKAGFDIHMDIFKRRRKDKFTRFDFGSDLAQPVMDGFTISVADDATGGQHSRMCL